MKNKIIRWYTAATLLLILSAVLIFLASCSAKHIEDTNGELTELCSITVEDIIEKRESYVTFGSVTNKTNDGIMFKAKKFSGVKSILNFKASGEKKELVINSDISLDTGNLRIVILHNGEFMSDINISGNNTVSIKNPSGVYDIRVAGESAGFDVKINYSWN